MTESEDLLQRIRLQVDTDNIRITLHAQQEMVEDSFKLDEVVALLAVLQ